jgi:bifunctional enzyme CysN/CysC
VKIHSAELIASDIDAYLQIHEQKDMLRFLTAGSVDDGKSTLIGRLLYDSKMIYEDQLAAVVRDSAVHGTTNTDFDPALLTDGLKAEREQGITIDVAYRYFSTEKRNFIIADTPGHEQYTRNMATGASTCDLAVILIDARHGVLAQTRRHSFIARLLGIRHLVIAVNKMDQVDYAESVFRSIRDDYEGFAAKLESSDLQFIPISALHGDNVVDRSANMPWYSGAPLLEYLENVSITTDRNLIDLRFPVQYVLRPHLNFRGYCGTLASGVIRPGDEVMALPSGRKSRVRSLVGFHGELQEAFAPMAVTLTLEDEIDVSRGDVLCHVNNSPEVGRHFEANLVWMNETPLKLLSQYLLKAAATLVPVEVDQLRYRFDINNLHKMEAQGLELNEIGRAVMTLHRPICFDSYGKNRQTGAFVLIDRLTNATVAAGMIIEAKPSPILADRAPAGDLAKAEHVETHPSRISARDRARRLGHQAAAIWLTGLPCAGKSSVAYALEQRLFDLGHLPHVLDGGNLRHGVSRDLGFSGNERAEHIRRAAAVTRICCDAGLITIAAFVSPFAEDRRRAREAMGEHPFLEIYLNTPVETCEARDTDGLYEKARRGEIPAFSGVTAPYEAPANPDLTLPAHELDVDTCVDRIIELMRQREVLS